MNPKSRLSRLLASVVLLVCIGWTAPAQIRRVDPQMERLFQRLQVRVNAFRTSLESSLRTSPIDNTTRREENVLEHLSSLNAALDRLEDRYRRREPVAADAQEVLRHAELVNRFMGRRNLSYQAERNWVSLRTDLTTLARSFNIAWRWDTPQNLACLTGTFRLDASRSDNLEAIAEREARSLSSNQRERVRNLILRRLAPPEMLAFELRGRSITMASTHAQPVTFEADGRTRYDENRQGRRIAVVANLSGDRLIINRTGERGREFYVTFDPLNDCRTLRVTRRVNVPGTSRRVTVQSTYNKTSEIAQLDLFRGRPGPGAGGGWNGGNFGVEDGAQLVATLNNELSTERSREGDRFTMTVRSPSRYEGAVIEGRVYRVSRSGRLSGRSEMALQFDRIRLPNGRSYDFTGYIETVRTADGRVIRVDNEDSIQAERGQTRRTVERAGIGAAIGAVLGAIIEGGEGALIGAAIGAGAGAGSIFIEGREDLDLDPGTEITLRAPAPREAALSR
jgi:hypothetical protein